VVERIHPAVIAALERLDVRTGRQEELEAGSDLPRRWRPVLVGVVIGAVLGTASYWAWSTWQARQLERRVSVMKTWPAATILGDVTVEVMTRCGNATLAYIVSLIPPRSTLPLSLWEKTDQGKVVTDEVRRRLKSIRLRFADKAGTPIADYELPIGSFVRIYSSDDERPLILEARGTTSCHARRYAREDALAVEGVASPKPVEPSSEKQ